MAKTDNLTDFLTDIADSLRAKKGTTEKINPQNFSTEIANLPSGAGGNEKFKALVDRTITEVTAEDLEGVTSIGNYMFYYCSSLTNIEIPDSVVNIFSNVFYGCLSLTSIEIPDSVKSIGAYSLVIGSSENKATIRMLSTTPPNIQSSTFNSTKLEKIIVPVGSLETYKTATNWSLFADYIIEEE